MAASRLIISGVTTSSEASRVIGHQFWLALADEYGTELPDLSALSDSSQNKSKEKNAVLVAGAQDESGEILKTAIKNSWLEVLTAESPEVSENTLREHENIDLFVLDLDDHLTDNEAIELVADYRRHLAWARIPALIRIPAAKPNWEKLLKEHGATSRFISRDAEPNEVVALIQTAISEKLDFKWGIDSIAN
jgi:response regulator RpfG family c-di-GMP phosphodiesterase